MSVHRPDRQPLNDREIAWFTVEVTLALVVWLVATSVLFDDVLHASGAWTDVVQYGGALAVALAVGWWRMIRFGPQGPPRSHRPRGPRWWSWQLDGAGAGLLITGGLAAAMAVALLLQASGDHRALVWGLVFAGLAMIQFGRLLLRTRRGGR